MIRFLTLIWKPAFILSALLWLLTGSAGGTLAETKLMVISDLHYMAPELYQDSDLFLQVLRNGDGKTTQHSELLLDALYRQILIEAPDALIVTGDLTYNGEKRSHEVLAEWFGAVEAAGVPVWVIPGNHDINTARPLGFGKGVYYPVDSITPEEFSALYADFMEPGEAACSYAARINDDLWVVMTDVARYLDQAETYGLFTRGHAAWLESVLGSASESGVKVITATHHSLIPHTEFAKNSFLMLDCESMTALAERYGVKLNLSGHLHIQHIARKDDMADAALGAFCIWPHRYAIVTLGGGRKLDYEARSLDETVLPDGFLQASREWFYGITCEKAKASLSGTDDEIALMSDYAARFNLAYFSGTYRQNDPFWLEDPAYGLWERQQDSGFWQYMKLVMNESSDDQLHWSEE